MVKLQLAIEGGVPVRAHGIQPRIELSADETETLVSFAQQGLLSDYWGGPETREFERRFAAYHGPNEFAVAVNSGTSALHLCLLAAGIKAGDEVIIPAFCFVSAATAAVQIGAVPVIADIDPSTLLIDIASVETLITERTRAVLTVHLWGYPGPLQALTQLCEQHSLILIEDTCQAPGARSQGQLAGTFGEFAAFSFSNRKHIATGEGGMVLTRTAEQADIVRSLANVGKGPGWDDYRSLGYSYRLSDLSSVFGMFGLERLPAELSARRSAAGIYERTMQGSELVFTAEASGDFAVYFKLPVLLPVDVTRAERDWIVGAIAAENVSCRVPHRPLFSVPWLGESGDGDDRAAENCPGAKQVVGRLIELETGPNLTAEDRQVSANALEKVWSTFRARAR